MITARHRAIPGIDRDKRERCGDAIFSLDRDRREA